MKTNKQCHRTCVITYLNLSPFFSSAWITHRLTFAIPAILTKDEVRYIHNADLREAITYGECWVEKRSLLWNSKPILMRKNLIDYHISIKGGLKKKICKKNQSKSLIENCSRFIKKTRRIIKHKYILLLSHRKIPFTTTFPRLYFKKCIAMVLENLHGVGGCITNIVRPRTSI